MSLVSKTGLALAVVLVTSAPATAQTLLTVSQDSNNIVRFNLTTHTSSVFASGLGSLYGLAISQTRDVYATEYNSASQTSDIHHFSASGADLGKFAALNAVNGSLLGLEFDSQGTLYAVERQGQQGAGEIHRFSATGADEGTFITGLTDYPSTIAFNSSGDALVNAGNTGVVREFSPAGTSLGNFATGQDAPEQIAVAGNGNVYINNFQAGHHIEKFSATGTDLGNFSATGGQSTGLAFDGSGDLWSANWNNGDLEEYSASGTRIGTYASGTRSPRELRFDAGTASAAPEPSAVAGLTFAALGLGGLLLRARRKAHSA